MNTTVITIEKLENDFRNIGVQKDDLIMLQSSLKSVGMVEGGADTVIDALLHVLGEGGMLMVPTFTYSYTGKEDASAFDIRSTPVCNTGIISETLRKREEAERSDHPSYSFAAIGKNSKALVSDHPINSPLGIGSPLHRLAEMGGKILLLGVGLNRNSLIHTAEAVAGMQYQRIPFRESWGRAVRRLNANGREEIIEQNEFPGCSYNFGIIEEELKAKGILKFGKAGEAITRFMVAQDVIDYVVEVLRQKPDYLLCSRQECECCINKKKLLNTLT